MKVVILGSTGLIGSAVGKYCLEQFGEDNVFLSYRTEKYSFGKNKFYFAANAHGKNAFFIGESNGLQVIPRCDYIINCIGVIKPFVTKASMAPVIQINSLFPRSLADYCAKVNTKLIQITTDCVFSGMDGFYTEESPHDCIDVYGKTKSLGEPDNCMVLRTSVIGEELHRNVSLVSWVKSQKGKEVSGYTNHYWNGITTKQLAKVYVQIIDRNLYEEDIFHVFSPRLVSKCSLVSMISKKFDLQVKVTPTMANLPIDRTLKSIKSLNAKLNIPSLDIQIAEM